MKFMFFIALFSFSAMAHEIKFKCSFTDVTYVNQFATEGTVTFEEGQFFNAGLDFTLRKAGRDVQTERLSVTRDGTVQIFPAGDMYRHQTVRIASAVKGSEVEYINLLIDVPPLHTSQIRFLNGMTYYGSCKSF